MTHPTKTAAADAAGTAADYSARATYARGWEDGRRSAIARAEKAEAENKWINCERTTLLCLCNEMSPDDAPDVVTREMAYDAVDQIQDRLYAAEGDRDMARDKCAVLLADALRLERARDEVGIQLVAAQAVIARMRAVVDAARVVADHAGPDPDRVGLASLRAALRALDTVPGDALARRP